MKTHTLRFPLTSVAIVIATAILLAAVIWDIDFIKIPLGLLDRIEQHEVDDIVMGIFLVIVAFIIDQVVSARRTRREVGLQTERLRIVKVTMRTVQDIVNNCLNQLQLVRFEAEGLVSRESLDLFDGAIQETAAKLRELGDLEIYTETQMETGAGLAASRVPPD